MAYAPPDASTAPQADVIRAISGYLNKILKPRDVTKQISGMKVLLLDKETKTILSMVAGMNEILSKDVYLVETIDKEHSGPSASSALRAMKAVCLLRPTEENIRILKNKLSLPTPEFSEYHLFFTNVVPGDALRRLADSDKLGLVQQVQEYYADFYPVNSDFFSLSITGSTGLSKPRQLYGHQEEAALKRTHQGLLATLLALKTRPVIRYQASSEAAQKLALELTGTISGERELFTFNKTGSQTLLLVVDRREDPVTPLLSQWTYQAMVHELLPNGISNNIVDLKGVPGVSRDLQEVVLSPVSDDFFRQTMYSNYGDLGGAVSKLLEDYSKSKGSHENVSSIADMARFIERFPELKSKGLAASKHVALTSTIFAAVESRNLFDLSEIEQNMVASTNDGDASQHFRDITDAIAKLNGFANPYAADGRAGAATQQPLPPGSKPVDPFDALRLLMLYCLRYERAAPSKCADLRRFINERAGVGRENIDVVDKLLAYGGFSVRSNDLFNTGTLGGGAGPAGAGGAGSSSGSAVFSRFTSAFKNTMTGGGGGGLSGVSNVYTQHQPYLVSLLSELSKGKLKTTAFPYTGTDPGPGARYGTVIVFVVGGCTFEEAAKVGAINSGALNITAASSGGSSFATGAPGSSIPPFRVILGGTNVVNSSSFIAELMGMGAGSSSGSSSARHTTIDMGGGAGVGTVHYSSGGGGSSSYGTAGAGGVKNWS